MVSRSLSNLAEQLARARREGQPWHVIARLLQHKLADRLPDQERRSVWDAAAKATGLAWVMLRRYVVVIDRVDEIARSAGRPAEDLVSGSFSAVELAVRIHARNPADGLTALEDLAARKATIDDLRKRLGSLPARPAVSERSVALRQRGMLIEDCERILAASAPALFGKDSSIVRRPPMRFCSRVGYDILARHGGLIAGSDLYVDDASRGRDPLDGLARSVLLSRYYPSFYLVLAPVLREDVRNAACRAVELFEVPWIGVVAIFERRRAKVLRSPQRRPVPDHSGRLDSIRAALASNPRA